MFVDEIIKYENGQMEYDDCIVFFQKLIDTGTAWRLQGHYARTAQNLIREGLCKRPPTMGEVDPIRAANKVQGW